MNKIVKTSIIKIGNSDVIYIPPRILKQLGISQEVELEISSGFLIIRPINAPKKTVRQGWQEQFQLMTEHGDDRLLDDTVTLTDWDDTEWTG